MDISDLPELLTTAEVAAVSRRTEKCIRNRYYQGKPPLPRNVGGRLLWRKEDVRAWLTGEIG